MAGPNDPIRITSRDLFSGAVEDYLAVQENLRLNMAEPEPLPWWARILYSNWFYLAQAGGLGALLGWMALEPFIQDGEFQSDASQLAGSFFFPTVAGGIGLFLGAAEGLMCRNLKRAAWSGLVGSGVGFVGAWILDWPTNLIYILGVMFATGMAKGQELSGLPFLVLMMGRGTAWAVTAVVAGIGQGIALKEWRIILNGFLGAVLGGLLGGLLFDPIDFFLSRDGEAAISRGVGVVIIGLLIGLFIGLIEGWTKTAWLLMKQGPLAGKQFIMHRDTTVLGSSPKAEIYLFKDPAIEPRHAIIHNRGGRFEIEDCDSPEGTYVNGELIDRRWLQTGDQITLGKTVLEFAVKEAE